MKRRFSAFSVAVSCVAISPLTLLAQAYDQPKSLQAWELDGPVYMMTQGDYIIAEAEDVAISEDWVLYPDADTVDGSNPTGEGFVEWVGLGVQGEGTTEDPNQVMQGPKENWLVVKFWANKPGLYRMDVRGYHRYEDGDNDFWISNFPYGGTIYRGFAGEPLHFGWMPRAQWDFSVRFGLHAAYLSPRSRRYGADRIAIYRIDTLGAKEAALDPGNPATPAYESRAGQTIFDLDRRLSPLAQEGTFFSWYREVYYSEVDYPWFYHYDHGWQYAIGGDHETGAWLYDFELGYVWTAPGFQGWFYSHDREAWIYFYQDSSAPRWFYDATIEDYFTASKSGA